MFSVSLYCNNRKIFIYTDEYFARYHPKNGKFRTIRLHGKVRAEGYDQRTANIGRDGKHQGKAEDSRDHCHQRSQIEFLTVITKGITK